MKFKLKSIAEEAAACRKAFENIAVGVLVVHCHHEKLFEFLSEPAENRITYILCQKPEHEQALRLHLFRPVNPKLLGKKCQEAYAKRQEAYAKRREADAKWQEAGAKWQEAGAKWREADAKRREAGAKWREADAKWREADGDKPHACICKNCPWNGKTIFPKEKN